MLKEESKMNNPEKLATRRKQIKQKHNTICVGTPLYASKHN
jgi:hypothetical protein